MSGDRPGVANLVETLGVRRRAIAGFALALAVTVLVYGRFVVLGDSPVPGRYLLLAFVFAVTLGLLLTGILVAIRAYRLASTDGPRAGGNSR